MGWLTALNENFYPQSLDALPDTPLFTLQAARVSAWAAQLAYEVDTEEKVGRILGRWGWTKLHVIRGRFASHLPLVSTKGFAATTAGGETVIAFAGTEPTSLLNWITDLSIHRTADGVHSGFLAGVEAVWGEFEPIARQARRGIYLTGHSLGGALAVVAARRLLDDAAQPDQLRGVYTIGMPRPGDAAYAHLYDSTRGGTLGQRTYRLVHGYDVVPRVPPAGAPFEFRHVGRVLSCDHGATFAGATQPLFVDDTPSAGINAVQELLAALTSEGGTGKTVASPPYPGEKPFVPLLVDSLPPSLRDHLPDCYLRALRE